MRKVIYLFVAALTAAVLSGCAKDRATEDTVTPEGTNGNKVTVTARIASDWQGPETRIGVNDLGGGQNVKLTWSAGDRIAMYDNNGNLAATLDILPECAGLSSGTFTLSSGALQDNASYTVIYPADGAQTLSSRNCSVDMASQQGNGTAGHLSGLCYMRANYIHAEGNTVDFALEFAMMTVVVSTPDGYDASIHSAPRSLTVTSGPSRYTLLINGITDITNPMTASMLIDPISGANRPLAFELACGNDLGGCRVFLMSTTTSVDYEAGKRYTADLSGANVLSLPDAWWLVDFSSSDYPAENTWVIVDEVYGDTPVSEFNGLGVALTTVYNSDNSARIRIIMPEAFEIPSTPDGILGIFSEFKALESISLPQATAIGVSAFSKCGNLTSVNLPKAETINLQAFYRCPGLESVAMPEVTAIGKEAFYGCENLRSLNMPKAKTIGEETFSSCEKLESVYLPEATDIGVAAFVKCTNLTSLNLPKATKVGNNAFNICDKLASANLPKVTDLGESAFYGCQALISFNLPEATRIGVTAFMGCTNLASASLPEATEIGAQAFLGCTNLASISIPKAETIGMQAFEYCSGLTSLEIATESAGLTSAPMYLFTNNVNLSQITLTIGAAESASQGTDVPNKMWRDYGPFKEIIVK